MCALLNAGLAAAIALLLAGCLPSAESQTDEQKDPFYLTGKSRLQERDYRGAIESFEKALETNPRSAAAHFELGVLYDQQENDYAAALYHYERAAKLRPDDRFAENARQRIELCKRELAKSVSQLPSMEKMQAELDRLKAENIQLRQLVNSWSNYAQSVSAAATEAMTRMQNSAPAPGAALGMTEATAPPRAPVVSGRGVLPAPVASATTRLHKVAPGETLAVIAKRYGVRLAALQAANPRIEARRLRAGHTLVIPPP